MGYIDNAYKKVIATVVSCLVLWVAYYGSYLPLMKSMSFISALGKQGQIQNLEDFKKTFDVPLFVGSPIGQEELVRNITSNILNIIQQTNDKQTIEALIDYAEEHYLPILQYGHGMSFGQNLYILGALNEVALLKTQKQSYLAAAAGYFGKGLERAPKRPQFLYGMFDVYSLSGDVEGMKRVGAQIVAQWPTDARIKEVLDKIPMKQTTEGKK